jgi:AraC family transcriptional regulator
MSHLIHNYSGLSPIDRSRGGLASWQERIATEILFARICDPPTADELGQACGVSARHFIRAFRQSTGRTPHQWLMQEQALKAKNLLEHSDRTLSDVRLRQSKSLLPRFPEILCSEPVDRKTAGTGER